MKIVNHMTEDEILGELGRRLTRLRLERNMTQGRLATEAGLGVRTLQRLEGGEVATRLSSLIRVCRVLGVADRLELLVPTQPDSPIAALERQGRRRQRASDRPAATGEASDWKWGEES